jgi:hypothetical protein
VENVDCAIEGEVSAPPPTAADPLVISVGDLSRFGRLDIF